MADKFHIHFNGRSYLAESFFYEIPYPGTDHYRNETTICTGWRFTDPSTMDVLLEYRCYDKADAIKEFTKIMESKMTKTSTISMAKKYQTRDGRKARIIATDLLGRLPIAVAITDVDNECEYVSNYYPNGHFYDPAINNPRDLIEVKPRIKKEVWLNVFSEHTTAHPTRQKANLALSVEEAYLRLACIKVDIDYEEGEGLGRG